jgi:four helix bundle suffix protein
MSEREPLIPPHGGYRKLKSFQVSQLIYDVTVRFCDLSRSLVKNQLAAQAAAFEAEGGFTERLYRLRTQNRRPPGRKK